MYECFDHHVKVVDGIVGGLICPFGLGRHVTVEDMLNGLDGLDALFDGDAGIFGNVVFVIVHKDSFAFFADLLIHL